MDRRTLGPAHLRAHRYARRRMDWALTLGTTLPRHDPGRLAHRCTVGSFVVALALVAAAGVLAIVRPVPDWSAAGVLVEVGSGAVFVNRDGVLHPALNLTSALLATDGASSAAPRTVSATDIRGAARGALIGVPGAPATLPARDRLFGTGWSLCDERSTATGTFTSTAVLGSPTPGEALPVSDAVLVIDENSPGGDTTALLWAGRRLPVDLGDRALVQALGLAGATPRPVSTALLRALPEAPPVTVIEPAGAGRPGSLDVTDDRGIRVVVGTVLRSTQADGRITLNLVHRDGIEAITPLAADLVMARTGVGLTEIAPGRLAALPETREERTVASALPTSAPRITAGAAPLVCVGWQGATAGWTVTTGLSLPGGTPVRTADPAGGRVDQVRIAPGSGAVVRPAEGARTAEVPGLLVTDLGFAYPVAADVPERLGLTEPDVPWPEAPSAVLDALPRGPVLSTDTARGVWSFGDSSVADGAVPSKGP